MSECLEGIWRDLLPDRVTGQLAVPEARRVDAHVADCAACRVELDLLQSVHAARPPVTVPSIEMIVARLPKPGGVEASVARDATPSSVVPLAHAPSRRRPSAAGRWQGWRLAASAVLMLGTGSAYLLTRPTRDMAGPAAAVAAVESLARVTSGPTADVSLSYGGAWDLSEAELQEVLATLEGWDGTPSPEIATTPLVLAGGGDQ